MARSRKIVKYDNSNVKKDLSILIIQKKSSSGRTWLFSLILSKASKHLNAPLKLSSLPTNKMVLLNYENYRPSGGTALLDAVGETITEIEPQIAASLIPTTAIIVILTDGYENASKKYNLVNIRNMISKLEETGKWTFSFVGATLVAVDVATSMAIKQQNSFAFEKANMKSGVFDKLSSSMENYMHKKRLGGNLDDFFS